MEERYFFINFEVVSPFGMAFGSLSVVSNQFPPAEMISNMAMDQLPEQMLQQVPANRIAVAIKGIYEFACEADFASFTSTESTRKPTDKPQLHLVKGGLEDKPH